MVRKKGESAIKSSVPRNLSSCLNNNYQRISSGRGRIDHRWFLRAFLVLNLVCGICAIGVSQQEPESSASSPAASVGGSAAAGLVGAAAQSPEPKSIEHNNIEEQCIQNCAEQVHNKKPRRVNLIT